MTGDGRTGEPRPKSPHRPSEDQPAQPDTSTTPGRSGSPLQSAAIAPASTIKKILLIRLREIGDVIFTTPAVHALRVHYPQAHLAYLVEAPAAPVVAGNPHLDELIVAPRPRGFRQLAADVVLGSALRAARFDLVIDFHGGPRASWLAWLSRAPRRVGYDVSGRGWMYTTRVARARELRPRHSVRNQWDLLEAIGIAPPDPAAFPTEMAVDASARTTVASRLASAGVSSDDALIVMHVSAGNPFRRWPIESFAAVAGSLVMRHERRKLIVTSGPSDRGAAGQVLEAARERVTEAARHRLVDAGEFDLRELRSLLDRAALYIGGDSGPMHVASTTAVPIVTLYGPTLPARSAPWRAPTLAAEAVERTDLTCRPCDQRVCAPGDFRCLTGLSPDQVVAAAERALRRGAAGKMS